MSHTLPHTILPSREDLAGNLERLILNLTACMNDAKQVDIADNYMASDRLTPNLRQADEYLKVLRDDLRSKRSAMRQRNEKIGSVDEKGEGVDYPINR